MSIACLKTTNSKTICRPGGLYSTFQEAHNVIENTDFGESVEYSSLGSHKSMKDYDIDTIMRLSNDAVLFAMLCQQYVQFKKQGV